ncbi:hypothetical protein [Rhizobium sp. GCM10022189]|uniref:hypothetical protein n=1 Tax=Rhizobium sp. GCM10022189 TaxID=3252654 RepID=UPI00360CF381
MFTSKKILFSASFIGSADIDLPALEDLLTTPLQEEIARMICSVSARPDRYGL